jgi:hypothetical protein
LIVRHLRLLGVMPAVDLDNQSLFETDEIHDVGPNRMLPAETQAVDLLGTYGVPKLSFTVTHPLSQVAGALVSHRTMLAR